MDKQTKIQIVLSIYGKIILKKIIIKHYQVFFLTHLEMLPTGLIISSSSSRDLKSFSVSPQSESQTLY